MLDRVEKFFRNYIANTWALGTLFLLAVLCAFLLSSAASRFVHPRFSHTEEHHNFLISEASLNDTPVSSESEAASYPEERNRKREKHLRADTDGHTRHVYLDFLCILIYSLLFPGIACRFGPQKLVRPILVSVGLLALVDILENAYILYQLDSIDAWIDYPGPDGGVLGILKWVIVTAICILLAVIIWNRYRLWRPEVAPEIRKRERRYIYDRAMRRAWNPLRDFLLFALRASIFGLICYGILSLLEPPELTQSIATHEHVPLIVMYVLYSGLMAGIAFAALAVLLRFMELFLGEASGEIRQFMTSRLQKLMNGKEAADLRRSDADNRGALFDGSGLFVFQKAILIVGATALGGFTLYQIVRQNPYTDIRSIQLNNRYHVEIATDGGSGSDRPRQIPAANPVPADLAGIIKQLGELRVSIDQNSRSINEQKKNLQLLNKKANADEKDINNMIWWLRRLQNEAGAHRSYSIRPEDRKW